MSERSDKYKYEGYYENDTYSHIIIGMEYKSAAEGDTFLVKLWGSSDDDKSEVDKK
jgi:hypothetical protein